LFAIDADQIINRKKFKKENKKRLLSTNKRNAIGKETKKRQSFVRNN
jgi:hypothetical protein